ncbi:MFS transporter [Labrys monachus]|uniref:MFS family permease n=1 Tax=Labrys monachus TaxID=217067 RepID=A0ABU0FH84_9HYPH|nr:MFS transporter [Labrys monachus]MDQ0393955.1 MFS family permease [Labrys monachus]
MQGTAKTSVDGKRRRSPIKVVRRSIEAVQGKQGIWPLQLLNFFMADMQAGIGPFLGVFLVVHGWRSGLIGTVMTVGGIAAMLMTAPAGALIDATSRKRSFVIIPGICTVLASTIILFSQNFWLVAASQVATSIAGAAIGPAVSGITLGIVRQAGFNKQNGRNQAFNHAGNMIGAGLSGFLGWRFGLTAVFWLAALFGVLSIISVMLIPREAINDGIARGLNDDGGENEEVTGFRVLAESRALVILAGALACFHLGNGAMLPLYGIAAVANKQGDPSAFVATTIVVAQAVMIAVSLAATWLAEKRGYWLIMLVSFIALPVRGLVAACFVGPWGVYPFQFLDGIAEGLQSVAVPALVARILKGTGRVNAGQGAVMTVQGMGGALSPALGGWIAEKLGYGPMFAILGSFALGSVALWVGFRARLKPASAGRGGQGAPEGRRDAAGNLRKETTAAAKNAGSGGDPADAP